MTLKEVKQEFLDELTGELERLFPKLNVDDPTKPSSNNRGEALVLLAMASNIFDKKSLAIVKAYWEAVKGEGEKDLEAEENEHKVTTFVRGLRKGFNQALDQQEAKHREFIGDKTINQMRKKHGIAPLKGLND